MQSPAQTRGVHRAPACFLLHFVSLDSLFGHPFPTICILCLEHSSCLQNSVQVQTFVFSRSRIDLQVRRESKTQDESRCAPRESKECSRASEIFRACAALSAHRDCYNYFFLVFQLHFKNAALRDAVYHDTCSDIRKSNIQHTLVTLLTASTATYP